MKSQFYELAARLERELAPTETLLCNLSAERSDFVRFNQARVRQAGSAAAGRDLVGFYAAGTIYRGFANSRGQRNWHEVDSFNFDWSLYHQGDQAVKTSYAGFDWEPRDFAGKMAQAGEQLEKLA